MALPETPQVLTSLAAPNLPIAPNDYSVQHFNVLNNVLRLFFTRVSTNINVLSVPAAGDTASRPINKVGVGQLYFDTTLGLPIWWNGTDWIDAAGTVV